MHRHAITACSRLNKSSPFLPSIRRYASQHVKPSTIEAVDSSDASPIPSPPDDAPPLQKKRTRKSEPEKLLENIKASASIPDLAVNAPTTKRRGRPPKVPDTTTADTAEADTLEQAPNKRTRKTKASKDQHAIAHGSAHHSSLSEFLTYASTATLSPTSTVYRGTHYEYTVANALSGLGFSLTRVGRASDLGIDLLGSWALPSRPAPLGILVQCKAEAPKPSMIRELEGAVVGAPVRYRGEGTIAILAAAKEATKGVRDAVGRSGLPMAYLNITTEGRVRQFVWNQAAVECGLEGVGVTLRYLLDGESEVALTWKGLPWSSSSSA
ncbi:hypothetical protein D6C98_08291 [Aureobasidium pullulans]|uniref:Required for respiratory growth protein 7, mitochondrial n=1 Tax=Aureobasidium pullulans TaxID=5580 RepID=A0A4S9MM36_AURPU|nr:hypothetical protein D6D22_03006 [Aureobasidium pullulans]THY44197.1 hypothetical protein D6C98_08291 [Aureobasidium pullulans]CAC9890543.1 unnamed protein product [Aureobasidium pullulans]